MKIRHYYDAIRIERSKHLLQVHLTKPHHVLSTCRINGGLKNKVRCMVNHQICEPKNDHHSPNGKLAVKDPAGYQKFIAEQVNCDADEIALFSTAANMNNAGYSHKKSDDLEVVAVITAGVESNAGCAGDPAGYAETPDGYVRLNTQNNTGPGTIITMLFINKELTPGAMVVANTVATEAKSSVMLDLNVGSNYSQQIATGTGTDQIGIASLVGGYKYRDAGKHSRLGELIGSAVKDALRSALELQNGMTPLSQRKLTAPLKRFAITEQKLIEAVGQKLVEPHLERWRNNSACVLHDCMVSASLGSLVHTWEQCVLKGVYPVDHRFEILVNQAAHLSCGVSSQQHLFHEYVEKLSHELDGEDLSLESLIYNSIALGYTYKWPAPSCLDELSPV